MEARSLFDNDEPFATAPLPPRKERKRRAPRLPPPEDKHWACVWQLTAEEWFSVDPIWKQLGLV